MQLIYRGQTFDYTPAIARAVRVPRAVNWRYQRAGENCGESKFPLSRTYPTAINWRYQEIVDR
jgi:hypothetical protein